MSLSWAGIEPVFCDVDQETHQIAIDKLDSLIDDQVTGIMGVNLWGGVCNPVALEKYAQEKGIAQRSTADLSKLEELDTLLILGSNPATNYPVFWNKILKQAELDVKNDLVAIEINEKIICLALEKIEEEQKV